MSVTNIIYLFLIILTMTFSLGIFLCLLLMSLKCYRKPCTINSFKVDEVNLSDNWCHQYENLNTWLTLVLKKMQITKPRVNEVYSSICGINIDVLIRCCPSSNPEGKFFFMSYTCLNISVFNLKHRYTFDILFGHSSFYFLPKSLHFWEYPWLAIPL